MLAIFLLEQEHARPWKVVSRLSEEGLHFFNFPRPLLPVSSRLLMRPKLLRPKLLLSRLAAAWLFLLVRLHSLPCGLSFRTWVAAS